ncbi:type II secretion protein F [Streptomyces sp. SID8358]|uniref:type II secretion system F family protein n=1 Tax=unclassified Streptomyces TaxID=2593676 RepID=UPI00081B28B4|nr:MULTISPECIES: type II secretion system F family protein [unclassified Streptomyces]MYU37632.1 type II secretion protein F [Streptomyces sp. SID8358]SCD35390.1 Type II secretion system (T2SS), protein F [Streptomyces sp. BpilaLS-43]
MRGLPEVMCRPVAVAAVTGVAAYLGVVVLAGIRQERAMRRRGAWLTSTTGCGPPAGWWLLSWSGSGEPDAVRRGALSLVAWAVGWFLVGGPAGCGAGCVAAYGVWRWQRSAGARRAATRAKAEALAVTAQLPLVADLLAACLSAGAGPRDAAEAVGESLGGPVGDRLVRTAAEIRLGGEPSEAWGRFGEIPGAARLARCLERAGATGAPAADPVSRVADEMRAERASAAVARAQRAGVLITAPVGLCFLPAFLAVGVAPVVIGLATGLLQRN